MDLHEPGIEQRAVGIALPGKTHLGIDQVPVPPVFMCSLSFATTQATPSRVTPSFSRSARAASRIFT